MAPRTAAVGDAGGRVLSRVDLVWLTVSMEGGGMGKGVLPSRWLWEKAGKRVSVGIRSQGAENEFDDRRRACHRSVENDQQQCADPKSIIFAVNVENWKNNQIGEQKCHYASETNPRNPEHRCQGHISDRAYKGIIDTSGPKWAPTAWLRSDAPEERSFAKNALARLGKCPGNRRRRRCLSRARPSP